MSRRRNFKARTERSAPSSGTGTRDLRPPASLANEETTPEPEAVPASQPSEPEAVAAARQRLELQRQAVGDRDPLYATALNQLALLLIMHGSPDQAEPLLRQALEIRQQTLGETHPDYATNLSSLAGLLWARGDLDGAEPLMRQSLSIRWDALGSGHPKTAASLNSLEQLLRAKSDWEGVDRLTSNAPAGTAELTAPADAPAASAPPEVAPREPEAPPALERSAEAPVVAPTPVDAPASVDASQPSEVAGPVLAATESPSPASARSSSATFDGGVPNREELLARCESLAVRFVQVGEELAQQAEIWKTGGAPPTPALIEDLGHCGLEFEELRIEVIKLCEALGTSLDPSRLSNLQEIAGCLRALGEVESRHAQLQAVRDQALALLDRVRRLRSADGGELAPLVECQAKAQALHAAIADAPLRELPDVALQLVEGDHPFHALLTLVESDGLDDAVWASSLEAVEAEFGKPLSVAAARSKIVSS